jgi:23S rRNA (uridine2552-2'-O)-methyltransferase
VRHEDQTKSKKVNKAWLQRPRQRPYVQAMAQKEGYRARAAYKLKEIDEAWPDPARAGGGRPGRGARCLEPVPAPPLRAQGRGRAGRRGTGELDGTIIALDLLEMEPIEGVHFIQGDFREDAVLQQLEANAGRAAVDVVVSDMAPNLSGIESADAARVEPTWSNWPWTLPAATCARRRAGGKVFHGSGYSQLVEACSSQQLPGGQAASSPRRRATSRPKPFWSASV